MNILSNETDGIIRLEAIALISFLYVSQSFENEEMSCIHKIMTRGAIDDLHWEVRIKALEFWDKVIWKQLAEHGMLDGHFPEVTFSKQHRKIVVLNDNEIKKRLSNVLKELNTNGCLEVLTNAIQEDPDYEVVRKGIEITKKFVKTLKKYGMISCLNTETICQSRVNHADFFDLIRYDLDIIQENRKKWLMKINDFELLLNELLRESENY